MNMAKILKFQFYLVGHYKMSFLKHLKHLLRFSNKALNYSVQSYF